MSVNALGISQISVNTADLPNGATIGSYLVDSAGALLTSTLNGAKQSLDVYGADVHAEDSAHVSGDLGSLNLGVRNDAGTPLAADGDYIPFSMDSSGALRVAATMNQEGDYPEDSAHVSGDIGLFSLAVRRDVRSSGVSADGDYASFNMNNVGELWVKDADALARLVLINSDTTAILADTATIDSNIAAILADTATIDSQTLSIQNTLIALSKAEDAPHSSGDQGIQSLLVRQDTLASSTSADGDYGSFKSNAAGELYVTNSSGNATLVSILAELAALSYAEDSAHVSGDMGIQALAVRNDTPGSLVNANGDYAPLQVDSLGNLRVAGSVTIGGLFAEDSVHVSGDLGMQSLAVRKDAQGSNVSADGDYSSIQTWSEGSLKVIDISNGTILQQQVSITSTASQVPAANLANRKSLMIQNTGSVKMYVGSATVTTSGATAGIELAANSFMELEVGPAVNVYVIKSGAGGATLNVLETA